MTLKHKRQLAQLPPNELKERLKTAQQELVEMRLKLALGQTKNTQAVPLKRQEIAIITTFLNQRK